MHAGKTDYMWSIETHYEGRVHMAIEADCDALTTGLNTYYSEVIRLDQRGGK